MRSVVLSACWIVACVGLIYLPDCGLGFIKDDYAWIASSRLADWSAIVRLLHTSPMGFYRPLVSLSFGVEGLFFGLNPLPYGLTNLALTLAAAAGIGWLLVRLGFTPAVALFAASVWILNFHGIGMAILWTSGRTSLLATLFAVAAACAFSASRPGACGVLTFLALLCKEEPLLLPVVFAAWTVIDRIDPAEAPLQEPRRQWRSVLASAIAVAAYLVMRLQSGAMTPSTAPAYYQYRLSVIPLNALQYADRSLTLTVSLVLLGALFVRRSQLSLTALERAAITKGLVWLVCGFALTIMIPVRSSLYVCLPAVGSALILAGVGSAEWRAIQRRTLVRACLLALPLAFLPVYRARNRELRNEQLLGTNVMRVLVARLAGHHIQRLIVYDRPGGHPSIGDAFGDGLPMALQLFAPNDAPAAVVVSGAPVPSALAGPDTLEFVLSGTTVVERSLR